MAPSRSSTELVAAVRVALAAAADPAKAPASQASMRSPLPFRASSRRSAGASSARSRARLSPFARREALEHLESRD